MAHPDTVHLTLTTPMPSSDWSDDTTPRTDKPLAFAWSVYPITDSGRPYFLTWLEAR